MNTQSVLSAGFSVPGGGKTPEKSEDQYAIHTINGVTLLAMGDGHGGYEGRIASTTFVEMMVDWMRNNADRVPELWSSGQLPGEIDEVYKNAHEAYRQKQLNGAPNREIVDGVVRNSFGHVRGGTTASSILIFTHNGQRVIMTSNVGDTEAMMVMINSSDLPADIKASGNPVVPQEVPVVTQEVPVVTQEVLEGKAVSEVKFKMVTTEHAPDNPKEYERISEEIPDSKKRLSMVYDTRVSDKHSCPLIYLPYDPDKKIAEKDQRYVRNPWSYGLYPTNARTEPAVYAVSPYIVGGGSGVCIAVTRGIGDFLAHQFGMSYMPTHNTQILPDDDEKVLICLATDGLWDCFRYEEFAEKVKACHTVDVCSDSTAFTSVGQSIMNDTWKLAKELFGEKGHDDITLITCLV